MALKGNQKVLDKDGDGTLSGNDFKLMGQGGDSPKMKYKQGGNSPEQFGLIKSAKNVLSADYGDLKGMDKFKLGAKNYFGGLVGLDAMNAPGTEDPAAAQAAASTAAEMDTLRNQMNKMGYNQNVMMMQNQGAGAAFAKKGKVYGQESAGEAGGSALAKKGCTRKRY